MLSQFFLHIISIKISRCTLRVLFASALSLSLLQKPVAQELSNIGKSPLLAATGGISLNQIFFNSSDSSATRKPYTYTLTANLNTALYGWSIPFSMVYSNQNMTYSQPFNQFTITPSYKWVRLHIGYSSMNFSSYTLSGHQFLGGGVELTPGSKFSFSAMGGRLQKSIQPDTSASTSPQYHRVGSGFKTEYSLDFGSIAAMVFYATDDKNSINFGTDTVSVLPMENLTAGLTGNFNILKHFSLNMEYATSILTENTLSPETNDGRGTVPLFTYRESTYRYNAYKSSFNFNSGIGSLGLAYERVDPGYTTLGAYYNTNDFENYTLNYSGGFFKNKVSLASSFGFQKDNLSGENDQDNTRKILNLNLGVIPIEKLNLAFFYSTFNYYTHIRSTFDDINTTDPYAKYDTLNYTQISENIGGTAGYSFGEKEKNVNNLSLSMSYQKASLLQNDVPENAGNEYLSASAGYSMRNENYGLTPALAFNYSNSGNDTLKTEIFGPSVSIRKTFLDQKLSTQLVLSYNHALLNKVKQSQNTIIRFSAGYTLKKNHVFNLSNSTALRRSISSTNKNETTVILTYRYSFSINPFDKKQKNVQDE